MTAPFASASFESDDSCVQCSTIKIQAKCQRPECEDARHVGVYYVLNYKPLGEDNCGLCPQSTTLGTCLSERPLSPAETWALSASECIIVNTWRTLFKAPRALKAPVACRFSSFRYTAACAEALGIADIDGGCSSADSNHGAGRSGVATTSVPAILSAAAQTSGTRACRVCSKMG